MKKKKKKMLYVVCRNEQEGVVEGFDDDRVMWSDPMVWCG